MKLLTANHQCPTTPTVPPVRTTAVYVRLTRDESVKRGLSAAAQEHDAREYAKRASLGEIVVYNEPEAVGGDVEFVKRRAGQRLIADIKAGVVSDVIVRDIDRLSRDVRIWMDFTGLCLAHEVTLHTFSGPLQFEAPTDEFAGLVRAAAAQLERRQVGDRVRRAKAEMARRGRHVGGPGPYGYITQATRAAELRASGMSADDAISQAAESSPLRAHLYLNPREADVVRLIFDWYVNKGWGCRKICNALDEAGYTRRSGKPWHADKLRRIINDPVLAGFICCDIVRFDSRGRKHAPRQLQSLHRGKHEPIITEELWRQAQKIKVANTCTKVGRGNGHAGRKYVLSGVLRCPLCGSAMHARSARAKQSFGYYVCIKRKYHGPKAVHGCRFAQLNTERIESAFWQQLSSLLAGPGLVDRVYTAACELARQRQFDAQAHRQSNDEIGRVRGQLDAASRRHAEAEPDSPEEQAATTLVGQLKRQLKDLKNREAVTVTPAPAAIEIDRNRVAEHLRSLGKLAAKSDDRGKTLVRSLVEHHGLTVVMTDDKTLHIDLRLRPPGAGDVDAAEVERYTVTLSGDADVRMPKDQVTAWVEEHQATASNCACGCGHPVRVLRRHFWLGLPEFRSECRQYGARRRWERLADMYTGAKVARMLGIGRTTLGRWVKTGKLPRPSKNSSGLLVFNTADIEQLVHARS